MWRIGGVDTPKGYIRGRLGCETEMGIDHWDDEQLDFVPEILPAGAASPFVIRLSDFAAVFQVRSPVIRVASFTGALRAILREQMDEQWEIAPPAKEKSFEEWRKTVDKIIRLSVRFTPPSSSEGGSETDQLITEMRLDSASLELKSESGIETNGNIAQQMLDHVDRRHVQASATGVRENGEVPVETVWDSQLHGESLITTIAVDQKTGEATFESLFEEVEIMELGETS
ncbi:hypothetical protein [Nonomuraea roseola]|uniref:Uncharacterized protein n=1 Tax=Nonomuraea roseola TaxID=46179 RepID=A0ABV5Q1P4_9ACTN